MVLYSDHDDMLWLNFILGSILCIITYENECETKKKTNRKKDKIEPLQILSIST